MHSFPFRLTFYTTSMAVILLLPGFALADKQLQVLSLAQAIEQVQLQNPALGVKQHAALAWAAKPAQAGSLADPVLSLAAVNLPSDTFSTSTEAMSQMQVGMSQRFPFPGKLALKEATADAMAHAANDDVDAFRLALIQRVQVQWWDLVYLDRAAATVIRNQELLRQLIRIVQTKYKVGKGLQQDVLLAQLELSKLLELSIKLKAGRLRTQARLNTLLNQPAAQVITLPSELDESLPEAEEPEYLTAYALASRPLLAQQQHYVVAARSRVALAKKSDYPDFTFALTYGRRADDAAGVARADLASMRLSMTLPFFTAAKQNGRQAQRQAELAQAEFAFADAQAQTLASMHIELAAYAQAKAQSLLFKTGIIPQAAQTVASMLAAYQVNKVDFLNLLRAQITLYNYETEYWKVLAQAKQSLARLDAIIGKETR